MGQGRGRASSWDWLVLLMPSGVIVLFHVLHRWLPGTTAGGLAFLCVVFVAYRLFPKSRVTLTKLFAAGALALLTAWLTASFWGD